MARKVLIGLDLQWNNLEKLRLENVPSTTTAAAYLTKNAAIAYFNSDNTLKYKDNVGVKTIATKEFVESLGVTSANVSKWNTAATDATVASNWIGDVNLQGQDVNTAVTTLNNKSANWNAAYNWYNTKGDTVLANSGYGREAYDFIDEFTEENFGDELKSLLNNLNDAVLGIKTGIPYTSSMVEPSAQTPTTIFPRGVTLKDGELYLVYAETQMSMPNEKLHLYGNDWTTIQYSETPSYYKKEGMCLVLGKDIYQYNGTSWVLKYSGADAGLEGRVSAIETMLNEDEGNVKEVIDTWEEVKNFLAGYENDTTLATKLLGLETGKLDKDAFSIGTKDGEKGVLTINLGTKEEDVCKFQKQHGHINGRSFEFWSPTKQSDINIGTVHGPTSPGNYGEFPMSLGSGAPTWKTPVISLLGNDSKVKWAADDKSFEISLIELGALFCSITLYETTSQNLTNATWNEIIADVSIIENTSGSDQSSIMAKVTFSEAMTHNKIRIFITPLYGQIKTTGGGGGTPVTPL